MGKPMTAEAAYLAFGEFDNGTTPQCFEQHKLDRLLELRAVIDSLRAERGTALLNNVYASQDRALPV